MRAEFINPFLQAATEVLEAELGTAPMRGSVGLQRSSYTSDDFTAVVAVTGSIAGMVMFAMTEETACRIVSRIMGQDFDEFDALAQSGIAEIGNVVTGRAAGPRGPRHGCSIQRRAPAPPSRRRRLLAGPTPGSADGARVPRQRSRRHMIPVPADSA